MFQVTAFKMAVGVAGAAYLVGDVSLISSCIVVIGAAIVKLCGGFRWFDRSWNKGKNDV